VTEDHQTKNALSLSSRDAAMLVPDNKVKDLLWPSIYSLLDDTSKAASLAQAIKTLALPNATADIVRICNQLINHDN
jgi:UDP-N-acetylglucosamine--N-acetylmuramyl-(pentapeptide) pyrophosphoryl-undecaprenol N-acetylglucosamine transferase